MILKFLDDFIKNLSLYDVSIHRNFYQNRFINESRYEVLYKFVCACCEFTNICL